MRRNLGWTLRTVAIGALALSAIAEPVALHSIEIDGRRTHYKVVDGRAITEGDIDLGPASVLDAAAKLAAEKRFAPANHKDALRNGTIIRGSTGAPLLWTDATMYYEISPTLPTPQRVLEAINEWNTRTPLKILPRTNQVNYVRFVEGNGCTSMLGMIGGEQNITLSTGCPKGHVIHEIGHAFGLLHEQSRKDRNAWLTVQYENIDSTQFFQFFQIPNARDLGYYDYDSIMHYPAQDFSLNDGTALESVPPGIPIGQIVRLSAGDIDNTARIYGYLPTRTTVTTMPEGLNIIVDGERYVSPTSFAWTPGSQHTISTDARQATSAQMRDQFVRWTDGGAQTHTVVASTAVTTFAATFQRSYLVSASATGNGSVGIAPTSTDGFYLSGSKVRITARPGAGQSFYRWTGSNTHAFGYGASAEVLNLEVRGPLNFQGAFTSTPVVTVTSNPPGAVVTVDGATYFAPIRFQAFATGSTHTIAMTEPTYTSRADTTRYVFQRWEDGMATPSRTVTIPAQAITYTASVATQHYLYLGFEGPGQLTVSPGINDGYFDATSRVTVTATPSATQTLQYWLGDIVSGAASQNIAMDQPKWLYGVFGPALPFRPVHAATYSSNPDFDLPGTFVTPLEIVTVFGSGLGPFNLVGGSIDAQGRLSTIAGGTRILFDGVPAPIIYASDGQTSVVVPSEVANRTFTVIQAERAGIVTGTTTASITASLPGFFTANQAGSGNIAGFNQDGTLNSATNGAPTGTVVTLYASGSGLTDRDLPNGAVTDANLERPRQPVYVRIGTQPAEVVYAGSSPGLVHGALQVNVRIPAGLDPGAQPIRLIIGNNASTPGTTIFVR
jgi:uncharacterized protein (TIGR03437 family)